MSTKKPTEWRVYIIRCDDDTLYTGITTDMARRWSQHKKQTGAKYFRGRLPKELVYIERCDGRSSASKREACIKKYSRKEKLALVNSSANQISDQVLKNVAN